MSYEIRQAYPNHTGYYEVASTSSEESGDLPKDVLEILVSRERVEEEINPSGNPVHVSLSNLDQGDRAVLRISGKLFVRVCANTLFIYCSSFKIAI